jgi:hypothetical protein
MSFSLYLGYIEIGKKLNYYCSHNNRYHKVESYIERYVQEIVTENVWNVSFFIPIREQMDLEIPSESQLNDSYKLLETI